MRLVTAKVTSVTAPKSLISIGRGSVGSGLELQVFEIFAEGTTKVRPF